MGGGPGERGFGAQKMVVGERAGAPPPAPLPNSSPKRQKAELKAQGDAVKSGKGKSYPKRSGGIWGTAGAWLPPPGLRGAGGRGGSGGGGAAAGPPRDGASVLALRPPERVFPISRLNNPKSRWNFFVPASLAFPALFCFGSESV